MRARSLQDKLGFVSATALKRMIQRETVMTGLKQSHVDLATQLIDTNITQAAGKTVHRKVHLRMNSVIFDSLCLIQIQ